MIDAPNFLSALAAAPSSHDTVEEPRPLTGEVRLERVIILVNPLSGGVGPQAADEAAALLAVYPLQAEVVVLEGARIPDQIGEALAARPDALFILAGDGTARSVAARAGPDGPLIAPLPGGTMNMLPKALYGTADWKAALRLALEEGAPQCVSGGEVEGEAFYCAAILGSPALWAPAREAIREGKLKMAWTYGRRALKKAFSGRVRYALDGGAREKAEALVLISPLISKAMVKCDGLEAAAMNTADAAQAFRLAAHALFDDWRQDPTVTTRGARKIEVEARSRIPAVIDGEPMLLGRETAVKFVPRAFMALAPKPPAGRDSV
ncbi:diacylglycerol kinase family protein [Brevundimonas sp. 3P9-tot-E]|uniref:diacylglycerol/lipid kinase family protein n=1 Tax=Brevundimonas TaxID=41275 RepID=UPI000F7B7BD1|nr:MULTISPECIES: diacylglycerol kinase family protein [Brevundimonas]MBK1976374.1 diacylglycerol kinase family lipid kinase [Brevundimonas diminuta]RSB48071.1 diacylglycerol kinase family lipid kinase [Brevundimonas sp. 357]